MSWQGVCLLVAGPCDGNRHEFVAPTLSDTPPTSLTLAPLRSRGEWSLVGFQPGGDFIDVPWPDQVVYDLALLDGDVAIYNEREGDGIAS